MLLEPPKLAQIVAEVAKQKADDAEFRRTFGVGPTDLDEAIDATLAARSQASAHRTAVTPQPPAGISRHPGVNG